MKSGFFGGRRWLATASLTAALGAVSFYGLQAEGKLPFTHPALTLKLARRSESAAGRGYSAVVKRVLPTVVNISFTKVVKESAQEMPEGPNIRGLDLFFRQFFGNDFGQRFNVPQERREKALGSGVIVSPEG